MLKIPKSHKKSVMPDNNITYGISLSGGGARGLAHIGVLAALEECGINPKVIAGSSMGAIIGAFYASGKTPAEMLEIARKESLFKLFKWKFPKGGMLSLGVLEELLRENIAKDSFSILKKELFIVVSNLTKAEKEVISNGKLFRAVLASASIPIIFEPQIINGNTYVDGGLFDDLPVDSLVNRCDRIIASHVNYNGPDPELDSMRAVAERVYRLAIYQNVKKNFEKCDIVIDPPVLRKHGIFDFKRLDDLYNIGYQETMKAILTTGGKLKGKLL
jgi:NTE family protein